MIVYRMLYSTIGFQSKADPSLQKLIYSRGCYKRGVASYHFYVLWNIASYHFWNIASYHFYEHSILSFLYIML